MKLEKLLGAWRTDPSDEATHQIYGDVIMEFTADGQLIYTILGEAGTKQIILLTYRVHGGKLITDQPSHPREECTEMQIVNGKLVFKYGKARGAFIKVENRGESR